MSKSEAAKQAERVAYAANPPICRQCGEQIEFRKRNQIFCSQKCWGRGKVPKPRKTRLCVACEGVVTWHRYRYLKYCDPCIEVGVNYRRANLVTAKTDGARRAYLLRTRSRRCAICGITEWMGQLAPLEMDHKDGNSEHNTEENLRLLCPNCHAQQPTSKGKNMGRGRLKRRMSYTPVRLQANRPV